MLSRSRTIGRSNRRRITRTILVASPLLLLGCVNGNMDTNKTALAESPSPEAPATTMASTEAGGDAPYTVECGHVDDAGQPYCYVDRDTYVGWRTYHAFCHVCHAQDAVGSTFAPSLLGRMKESDMTKELFDDRLHNGFTGQMGVMPPWKDNPNVSKRYDELYAYLMARADGALPPGRPKRKPNN